MTPVSAVRRREVIDALRRGTVPRAGLDLFAVGLDRFAGALDEEIAAVGKGGSAFRAIRGEYGSGKTFFARWLGERAKRAGLAAAEIQISETETPLHRLETVYRRLTERLTTATHPAGALRPIVDLWFYTLEEEVLDAGEAAEDDTAGLARAVDALMERRLASVARTTPAFAAALRGYRRAREDGDAATAEALIAWLGGQRSVAASARQAAGVRGDLDHFGALGFLQGLLTVLRDCGHPGLLVVLDEIETLQRVRGDVREKGLNALRQLLDEIDGGRFPGLFLVITGTPAFFDGRQGVQRLAPLAQRLATDFTTDPRNRLWVENWNGLPPFDRSAEPIVRHLADHGFVEQDGEYLFIGPAAEERFGRRHFMDMTAVFTAPPEFTVLSGRQEIGRTDPMLLTERVDGPRVLLLAGHRWQVTWIDWKRRRCYVEPSDRPGRARWYGTAFGGSGFALTRACREVLLGADPPVALTERAVRYLAKARDTGAETVHPGGNAITRAGDDVRWWTWAGFRANAVLTATLAGLADEKQRFADAWVRLRPDLTPAMWKAGTADAADRLCLPDVDERAVRGLKFNEALPARLATATLAARLADLDGALAALSGPVRFTLA